MQTVNCVNAAFFRISIDDQIKMAAFFKGNSAIADRLLNN